MARIYSRSGKKGTHWYVDYSVAGRCVRKRVGRSKKLADFIAECLVYAKTNKSHASYVHNEIVLRTFKGYAEV